MSRFIVSAALIFFASGSAAAEDVRIVLWNGEELFTPQDVENRASDFQQFAADTQPDILLIDEVCSLDVVKKIRDVMGLAGYHVVCSDFNQRDDLEHSSFEVGIISKFPLDRVVEYDQTPDNKLYFRDEEPNEALLTADSLLKLGLKQAGVGRGFLWARMDALKLTFYLTHLKSSRSGNEGENAMKREYVAAAMALSVLDDKQSFPDYTMIVAGDLNVGATDASKNGEDLDVDEFSGQGDRYDETHALLSKGLVGGLAMKNLCLNVGETYDDPQFAGSGPIDCIYVSGPHETNFTDAIKTNSTYGSDHFSVWTVFQTP